MTYRARTLLFPLLVFAAAMATPAQADSDPERGPTAAPHFALPGRSGNTVDLDSLQARMILVDFWASWCVPCRKSFPWMNALHKRYGAKGLAIVAVNLDKDRAPAEDFLKKNPAEFTVAFDPAGRTAKEYRVSGMPSTYLIDADGAILIRHVGFDPKQTGEIEAAIEEALAQ